jgi:hypothetical protein
MSILNNLAGSAVGAITDIWGAAAGLHLAWINRNGIIYAYDYETRLNLELLDAFDLEALSGAGIDHPALRALINRLETTIGASILFGLDRRRYRRIIRLLKKYWSGAEALESESGAEGGPEGDKPEAVKSVLAAMSFSIRKIEALKRLTLAASENAGLFHPFRLPIRVQNLRKALLATQKSLAGAIKQLAA